MEGAEAWHAWFARRHHATVLRPPGLRHCLRFARCG